jgi:hypothetical protein
MDRLDLVWHESANPLYADRFSALAEYFDLNVYGFTKFQGKVFDTQNQVLHLRGRIVL